MRTGYGIAKKEIIEVIHKLRPPFNITNLSLVAAIEALKDEVFVEESIKKNFEEMKEYENYAKKKGISYIDSFTNFITFKFDEKYISSKIALELLKKGIIVRDLSAYKLNAIRITIGTKEQNKIVLNVLNQIIENTN